MGFESHLSNLMPEAGRRWRLIASINLIQLRRVVVVDGQARWWKIEPAGPRARQSSDAPAQIGWGDFSDVALGMWCTPGQCRSTGVVGWNLCSTFLAGVHPWSQEWKVTPSTPQICSRRSMYDCQTMSVRVCVCMCRCHTEHLIALQEIVCRNFRKLYGDIAGFTLTPLPSYEPPCGGLPSDWQAVIKKKKTSNTWPHLRQTD